MSESPEVGGTYALADEDYRFGAGALLCRVTKVIGECDFGEGGTVETWWEVEGICKFPSTPGPGHPRQLYLRAASLQKARRPERT